MHVAERLKTVSDIMRHPRYRGRRAGAVLDYLRWNLAHRLIDVEYVLPLVDGARLIVSKRQNYATLVYTCGRFNLRGVPF